MELLVVIAIIALLVSILLPALNKAKMQARCVLCGSNFHQVGVIWQMYSDDDEHERYPANTFPPGFPSLGNWTNIVTELRDALDEYGSDDFSIFYCPSYWLVRVRNENEFPESYWDSPRTDHINPVTGEVFPMYYMGITVFTGQDRTRSSSARSLSTGQAIRQRHYAQTLGV